MKSPSFSYQQLLGSPCDWTSETGQSSVSENSLMLGQLSPSNSNSSDSALQTRREANNARERIRVKRHRESFMDLKDVICRHVTLGKDVSRLALLRSATELIKKLEADLTNANQNGSSSRNGSLSGPPSPVSSGAIDLRNLQISQGAIRGAMADFQAGLPHPFVPSLNNVDPSQLFNPNIAPQVSVAHAMQYQHPLHLTDFQQNMVNHPFEYTL
ncbi:unnamed protein product [Oikopleura dioica]|uniref:BHLH domain-containing protein n=1 Tax=Oikopleura dioica TaxID=34765 RepID=E4XDF7_OIKDI|nr:unnamed protein product [Oikopleura dioica]